VIKTETESDIVEYLESLSDPDIAAHSQRFFKTGPGEYGEGDVFLGIRVPAVRKAVARYPDVPRSIVGRLIRCRYHEVRLFAVLALVAKFNRPGCSDQESIYRQYLSNTEYINNWDLVDSSAHQIVGGWLNSRDRSDLDKLSGSQSLWERRIAIIATLHFIRQKQFDDTLRIADHLLRDDHDLIHKAVGWMLREVGKRDKSIEVQFLLPRYREMPRVMLRYAIEHFSAQERRAYLKGEVY
jgi:3-methyladenine DNA glycosylase AlkD